jgi:O-antigen/teichoic acid export membrane protein
MTVREWVNGVFQASNHPWLAPLRTPLVRNAYALIFSTVTTSALGMIYWVLAARFYTSEIVGLNAAAISAMVFVGGVSRLYLDGALMRFIPRAGQGTLRFVAVTYLISQALVFLVAGGYWLGRQIWATELAFLGATPWLSGWFILSCLAASIFVLQDAALTGLRQTVWVPVENTLFAIAKLVFLVAMAGWSPEYGIFLSWTIPMTASLLPINWLIFKRLIPQHMQAKQGEAAGVQAAQVAHYIGGNYVGYLFHLASARLLPILVVQLAGGSATAYFYLPWLVANSLQLAASHMSASLTVEASRDQTHLQAYGRQALRHTARLLVPAVAVLVIGAPYVLLVFGREYAHEGTLLLRLFALSSLPAMFNAIFLGMARVERRIRSIIAVQALMAVLSLGLGSLFLQLYGITGVGAAWLLSQTLTAALLLATYYRRILWKRG